MAVSQYLRPQSLLDAVRNNFTPDVVRKASSLVGESESSTRSALNGAVPSVFSGLVNMVSSRDGGKTLFGMIRDGGFGAASENVSSLFGGGSATNNMLSSGQQLLGRIFGNRSSSVTDLVAKSSGVSSSAASKLMSLAAPLTLGVLGKQGLDASGLTNTLLNGKSEIAAAAPAGLSQILSGGPTAVRDTVERSNLSEPMTIDRFSEPAPVAPPTATYVEEQPKSEGGMRWLPLLLIALGALGLLFYLLGRTPRRAEAPTVQTPAAPTAPVAPSENVTLPGGHNISVPRGSINYNLATFLADKNAGPIPKTFVFDNLNFESASTQLTPSSVATVNDLAMVMKSYPDARVQLVGHTDNTGNPDANQKLSLDRANAVKAMLVNQGVNPDSVTTAGYGESRPVASNDTEEGRQQNRRLELNVLNK